MNELLKETVDAYIENLVVVINEQLAELHRAETVLANLDAMLELDEFLEDEPEANEVECCRDCASCINRCEEFNAVEFVMNLLKDMSL